MREINEEYLRNNVCSLIDVRRTNLGYEVQFPVVYPNGDLVSVTINVEQDHYIIHDSGNGSMILSSQGINITRKIAERLDAIAKNYGCEFLYGRMSKKCSVDDLAVCAAVVANASRSIGDQIFYQEERPVIDFRRDVLERVRSFVGANRYRENEEVYGESGYPYKISAVVLNRDGDTPIGFVEPVKDHEAATKKFREFWDIAQAAQYEAIRRVALYNDKRKWAPGDLMLLQNVSNVVRLSDAETRMKELVDAGE